jgi:RNA polymerase-binding transcription factor DksA
MATPKRLLKKELKEAEKELAQVLAQLEERPDFGLGTGSTGVFTWEMALARRKRVEEHIEMIQTALALVEAGEYGICQTCGAKIDPERLEIVPCTVECSACARKGSNIKD